MDINKLLLPTIDRKIYTDIGGIFVNNGDYIYMLHHAINTATSPLFDMYKKECPGLGLLEYALIKDIHNKIKPGVFIHYYDNGFTDNVFITKSIYDKHFLVSYVLDENIEEDNRITCILKINENVIKEHYNNYTFNIFKKIKKDIISNNNDKIYEDFTGL